jgi:hypothetical protein
VPKFILIVDDSALIRSMIRETLEQHGGWEVSDEAADRRGGSPLNAIAPMLAPKTCSDWPKLRGGENPARSGARPGNYRGGKK